MCNDEKGSFELTVPQSRVLMLVRQMSSKIPITNQDGRSDSSEEITHLAAIFKTGQTCEIKEREVISQLEVMDGLSVER